MTTLQDPAPSSTGRRLQDKVAVITGASSGIGRATMEVFAREGAKVVGCGRRLDALDETLRTVKTAGGDGIVVSADLEDPSSADQIVEAAIRHYGRVDVLVNNAGVGWSYGVANPGTMAAVHGMSLENWRDVIGGVSLESYFLMLRACLPPMMAAGSGAIVNIGSVAGVSGLYDAHAYTAAKGAIVNLTRSLAISYIGRGIRSNSVCPGFVDTPDMAEAIGLFLDDAAALAVSPIKRPAQPSEIAYPIAFLASDEASYVNGATFVVDGGTTARAFPGSLAGD